MKNLFIEKHSPIPVGNPHVDLARICLKPEFLKRCEYKRSAKDNTPIILACIAEIDKRLRKK